MICPNCQSENLASAVFCRDCGSRLPEHEGLSSGAVREAQPFRQAQAVAEGNVVHIGAKYLGELVGGAFAIYRKNPLPFFALALLPQIPLILLAILVPGVDLADIAGFNVDEEGEAFAFSQLGSLLGTVLVLLVAMIFLTLLSLGGIIHATGQHYLGRRVEFLPAVRAAGNRIVPLFVAGLLLVLIMIIPVLLSAILVGIPVLVFLTVRLYFALNALMLEDLGPTDAIKRSWRLVEGCWWRTFGIGIIFILLALAATLLASLLTLPVDILGSSFLSGLVSALAGALVTPFIYIGGTVVYLDLRVRHEGESVKIVP